MFKLYIKHFWLKLRRDPMLCALLLVAAAFFIFYYVTDPVRQPGLLPDWLSHTPLPDHVGWFGFYDQSEYLRLAHTLAKLNFSELHRTYTYGLGYPLVAVPAIWLGFNKDPFVLFNFAAFVFAIYATYRTAKELISPFAGFVAGFGLLFATPLIYYVDQPWNSTVCLVVMSAILLTITTKKVTRWRALMLGLLVGWSFAARYIDVIFLGALSVASVYVRPIKAMYKPLLFMGLGAIIVAVPVLYSHQRIFGSPFHTPYVRHLGIGGVDGSDQGLKAYSLSRIPGAAMGLFVSPRLAGSPDFDRGLLVNFFWALAAIPGAIILIKRNKQRVFIVAFIGVGLMASVFYLSFRASTPGSLKYGELHYFKMFWPFLAILAAAFFDYLYCHTISFSQTKGLKPRLRK